MRHLINVKGKVFKFLSSLWILFCLTLTASAQGPVIDFTPLGDACGTSGVTLTATITDPNGVPTTGASLPVLYYRIGGSSYMPVTATHSGGDTYTFSGVGAGAFTGAVIYYYIAAQNNLGEVSVSPSAGAGVFSTNPPAAGEPPTEPLFYVIKNLLAAGTYRIGSGLDFPTITDAVNAYNNSCLNGHVVFSIEKVSMLDGTPSAETLPITIEYNPQSSASRTLTIKPGLNSVQILQTANDGVFRLNGAQYITIDGSVNGTSSRNFKVSNLGTTGTSIGVWITSSTTRPAQHITIKNMIFNALSALNGFGGIVVSAPNSPTEPVLFPCNNIQLINNALNGSRYGILVNGAATNDQNLRIFKNWVGTTVNVNSNPTFALNANTELLAYRGISVSNQNNLTIDSNYVHGVSSRESISTELYPTAGIALEGHISNTNITRNQIFNIKNIINPPALKAVYGIAVNPTNNNNNIRIYNNMISRIVNVTAPGLPDPAISTHGIAIMGGTGHRIVYNTVQLNGSISTTAVSSCLFISEFAAATNTIAELKNNIFSNIISNGFRYSIYAGDAAINVIGSIDYNNYYSTSTGSIGYIGGAARVTLGSWQSATSQDQNSVKMLPSFMSVSDLRLQGNSPMNEIGTPIAYVTKDFQSEDRDPVKPDMGADEVVPPPCDPGAITGGTLTVNSNMVCFVNAPSLFASGYSQGFGITYQWQMSTDNATFVPIPGQTNPATANSPDISVTTYYRLAVTCSGTTVYSNNTITVNVFSPAIISSSNNVSRCGVGTVSLNATPNTGASVRWYNVPTSGAIISSANTFTTPTLTENTTFYVEASQGGVNAQVGPGSPTAHGGTIGKGLTSYKVFFNINFPTKLLSVDIFPYGSGEVSTLTISNSDNNVIATIPYVTTVSGGATAQTIPINVTLQPGTGYYLWTTTYEDLPVSGLARNTNGSTYPYGAASSPIQITGSEMLPHNYVYYYRWRYSTACESPRVPVNVTITPPPPITAAATPPSVCAGAPTTLSVSSPNPNYIYRWNPGNRPGASIVVNPSAHTTYIVTANDGVCANADTVDVAMNAMPETVFAPADVVKCAESAAVPLTVTGGVVRGEPILLENFNSADDPPPGWAISINGSTGSVGSFIKRPNGYNPEGFILESNDKTQFYLTDVQSAATHTSLRTPRMNFSSFVNINFTFYHHYRAFMSDTVYVEISTVPGTPSGSHAQATIDAEWTTIAQWQTYPQGGPRNFQRVELDLSPWAGEPSVYIRFRMKNIIPNEQGYYWAIDNVYISGDDLAPSYTWSPVDGLFEDAAGTIPYSGNPISTIYAAPDVTTQYIAASTGPNGCSARDTTLIELYPVGGVLSGDNVICVGGNTNLSVTLTGTAPWTISYTDGVDTYMETGIMTSPHIINVSPTATTTYTLLTVGDANCAPSVLNASGTATINLTSFGISSWLGNSADWFDQNNWCGIVPDISTDVIIPSGTPFNPEIDGSAAAKNITINTNSSLWIFYGSSLNISGNVLLEGTLINDGEVIMEGAATQSLADGNGTILAMNALTIEKLPGTEITIKKKLFITEELKMLSGTINILDTITIRSTLTRTARIDKIGSNVVLNYGQGRFITERYFPEHPKAWQLISASTFGQSLNEAWQENATLPLENNVPGYGTIMTSNLPNALVEGFDIYTSLGSTVTTYNPNTNLWDGVTSTSDAVSIPSGYMIYVRGDRSVQDGVSPATEVTLRSTGRIYSPQNPPSSVSMLPNKFTSVGNPYASAIDFNALRSASSGVDQKFYVWDHELWGTSNNGGWQTISSANGWRPIPGGTSNYPTGTPVTTLQSGQAFLVFSSTGGTVNMNENIKVDEDRMVFRNNGVNPASLTAHLYNSGGMADGNAIVLDEEFSNDVDADDAKKFISGGHQFGIMNNGTRLSVEARSMFTTTDTIYYDIRNLGNGSYRIMFTPENMPSNMQAWVIDNYLQTETPVDIAAPTTYAFTVNSAAASRASNRFHIVFVRSRILPVTITRLQAVPTTPGIEVKWEVSNEVNIARYEVLHSSNGSSFESVGEVDANGGLREYSFLHTQPVEGVNYYRLRIHENDGTYKYSEIVTALWQNGNAPAIVIAPNPVLQHQGFTVSMHHVPAGEYVITLYNASAQVVHSQAAEITGVQNSIQVYPRKLSAGIYYLVIAGERMREKRVLLVK